MSTCRWSDTKHIASDKNKIKFNKMKKLFFLILTIAFSSFYAKSQIVKIAEINSNGTISFVVSTQTLLDNWKKMQMIFIMLLQEGMNIGLQQ
jgi:hypothetical protein